MHRNARHAFQFDGVPVRLHNAHSPGPRWRGDPDHHGNGFALHPHAANQAWPIAEVERFVHDQSRAANLPDRFEHQRSGVVPARHNTSIRSCRTQRERAATTVVEY
jgi:hypothetical protein